MNLLVTAGNTKVMIDRVRCITNSFTGRTGTAIALHAHDRGHNVTLLTSHPEVVAEMRQVAPGERWTVIRYDTFADLQNLMAEHLQSVSLDAIVHCAAVSDYLSSGIYGPAPGTRFDPDRATWHGVDAPPALLDRTADKVKSDEPELWLRLVRAPKLIDYVRGDWAFRGVLVKFKLEVGRSDADLLDVAERSRLQSAADLMVANTLEDASRHAFLGPLAGRYEQVSRAALPGKLLDAIERLRRGQGHG